MGQAVLFEELPARNGKVLGVVTLNAEKTLNSLSLDMIDSMAAQLETWRGDARVAMLVLQAAGDRAFCAGGDIQDLYASMVRAPGGPNAYALKFFESEYRLDYMIHSYPKPILCFAHGIVMGGGLGIMAASSHRLATEKSRIAMPEITIGLFPDAGATWSLSRMPKHLAHFIALTGPPLNGADAIKVGLADRVIRSADKPDILTMLQSLSFDGQSSKVLAQELDQFKTPEPPAGNLERHEDIIKQCILAGGAVRPLSEIEQQLTGIDDPDTWLSRAIGGFVAGCPTTAHLIMEQLERARSMTLAQMFMQELVIAVQCSHRPDFTEGVRALLIDKDNKPDWRYKKLTEVPNEWVQAHFALPWDTNPLQDLLN